MKDEQKIKELLDRGVKKIISRESLEKKLKSGKILRIKHGVDPTTPDLHLGYAVIYRKLKQFQDLGHKVVFLIGDFTGRFGDPTEKTETRKMREKKEVKALAKNYISQVGKILDAKKLEIRYNGDWYDKMSAEELLHLMSKFTTAQMMQREMFQERAGKGLETGLHEPVYPVLQGYDSVMLKSDATAIGSDQEFNELQGRRLQEIYNQAPQDLVIMPILTGLDGEKKMSQSLGNYIGITEAPEAQYGKIMSIPDKLLSEYFGLLTDLSFNEKENPRDAKMRLAFEIVKTYHSEKEAKKAQENFVNLFQKKEIPTDIPEIKIKKEEALGDILVENKIISSKGEFRRLLTENAIDVDGKTITDVHYKIEKTAIIKIGKRKFVKIILA
ncbi:MAG: tyrosine--tRNA ligase [Candidatus Paceibacterota bacterium]